VEDAAKLLLEVSSKGVNVGIFLYNELTSNLNHIRVHNVQI